MPPSPDQPEGIPPEPEKDGEAPFDVREFARTARGSHRDDPVIAELIGETVPAEAVYLIRVLRDLERTTMERMRNLLVTATHKDGRMTAFLTTWAFEKFWIADALDAALGALGEDVQGPNSDLRPRRSRTERAERRGPIARAIVGNLRGAPLVAAHVATGLVDELIGQAAYRRLGLLHERLAHLAQLAIEVKERHVRFFADEAQRRLDVGERDRRLARIELSQAAWPLGSVHRPAADRSFFEAIIFGDDQGRAEARSIADRIAALPGLAPVAATVAGRLAP